MADLFDLTDLPSWLQVPSVDTETATRVRRYASGWLQAATGVTPWPPDPVPDDIWAWGIELAGIAFRNPTAVMSEAIDDYNVSHDRERRAEILAAAKATYGGGGTGTPLYSFPDVDWHWTSTAVSTALTD